jgi:hypothetical protein
MIKHVVMWRLKDQAQGQNRAQNAQQIKARLESLNGKIPGLRKIEVGIDLSNSPESSDLVCYSEFDDQQALGTYLDHPLHKTVSTFLREAKIERRVVDYAA